MVYADQNLWLKVALYHSISGLDPYVATHRTGFRISLTAKESVSKPKFVLPSQQVNTPAFLGAKGGLSGDSMKNTRTVTEWSIVKQNDPNIAT